MSFKINQTHIDQHRRDGITVFRNIIPVSLLADLRREASKALEIARRIHGPQAQRVQPVSHYSDIFHLQPFRDYEELPELNDAVKALLGPDAYYNSIDLLGILVGPPTRTNCMQWHMDLSEKTAGVDAQEFSLIRQKPALGNQVNCPLFQDNFLWFVPGSHLTPVADEAVAVANSNLWFSILERLLDDSADYCAVQLERDCLAYMWSMPGANRIQLEPGDFAIYRPFAWHAAFYSSEQSRATLHHGVWTEESYAWWQRINAARGSWRDRYERPVTADGL
jgi:hypothetical protein